MSVEYQNLPSGLNIRLSKSFPCPYLPNRLEKDLIISLSKPILSANFSQSLYENLCQLGFRRNGEHAYKPMCDNCQQCMASRVIISGFKASSSQKRILRKNNEVLINVLPSIAYHEHYELFTKYLKERHQYPTPNLSFSGYRHWIENAPIKTNIIEFRERERLLGCMIVDVLADGFSAVYSFYDPILSKRSFGNFMILRIINMLQQHHQSYFYLGYAIQENPRMKYKLNFHPNEFYHPEFGWQQITKK